MSRNNASGDNVSTQARASRCAPSSIRTCAASIKGFEQLTGRVTHRDSFVQKIAASLTHQKCLRKREGVQGSADEFITEAVNRKDVLRMARVGFELLSEPGDVNVDRARRRHGVIAPHFI